MNRYVCSVMLPYGVFAKKALLNEKYVDNLCFSECGDDILFNQAFFTITACTRASVYKLIRLLIPVPCKYSIKLIRG